MVAILNSLCVVDCSRIKWAWLRLLAVHDHSFVLKRGIKLVRLSFTAVYQVPYSKFSPQTSHLSCDFKDSYTSP